jgi:hypothetical protein
MHKANTYREDKVCLNVFILESSEKISIKFGIKDQYRNVSGEFNYVHIESILLYLKQDIKYRPH